jgi:hypothetical protein
MRVRAAVSLLVLGLAFGACAPRGGVAPVWQGRVAGVPRSQCFPADRLPPDLRTKSEEMLLRALGNEALYTLVRGLKPMSTVGSTLTFDVDTPDSAAIAERRRLLSVWHCGDDIFAGARVFRAINDGKRSVSSEVFYRPALDAVLSRHAAFFAPLGLTRQRRARYIGAGKPGAFALLRDWYCGGDRGSCSAANAH